MAIGVSTTSVDQMVAEGALPPPRKWHSRKLWLVAEVKAYLSEWPVSGDAVVAEPEYQFHDSYTPASEPAKGVGGYPIVTDRHDPIKQYYDALGFDPVTMGEKDMMRLVQEDRDRWKASIPGTPLGKREQKALRDLAAHGVGVVVKASTIKGCSTDTEDRLVARGFITTFDHPNFPNQIDSYILTAEGLAAFEELNHDPR